jgi:UDP-N-acetylglucosamine--dolichyl-phosphate N-acetylglucosaminephosphotransferase
MVYYAEGGLTQIVVPIPFRPIFGRILELGQLKFPPTSYLLNNSTQGPLYYVYMSMLSTFSTNSINILAGINAVEVSQALIIALSVLLNDMLYLPWTFRVTLHYHLPVYQSSRNITIGGVYAAGLAHGSKELVDRHLLSAYFMLPLIGVCLGFLYHNWFVTFANALLDTDSKRIAGIQREFFRVTPYAIYLEWRLPL